MKIRLVVFCAMISLLTSQTFAKENSIETKLNTELSTKKSDDRESIKSFDFDKMFAESEKYFKAARAWEKIKCEPKSGFICSKHECNKKEIRATILLDKEKKTITRCEANGQNCETFSAEFEQTGVYYNVQSKGPIGTLIRILGDSRYKEITTVALDAYIANGECKVVVE